MVANKHKLLLVYTSDAVLALTVKIKETRFEELASPILNNLIISKATELLSDCIHYWDVNGLLDAPILEEEDDLVEEVMAVFKEIENLAAYYEIDFFKLVKTGELRVVDNYGTVMICAE